MRFGGASDPRRAVYVTLRRKPSTPVWVQIGWRVLFVVGLLAVAVLFHWIERDGLRDSFDHQVSFTDVIYFTMISITTTGYGDIAPVSQSARLFDALVVTPIRVFVIVIFLGTTYQFVLKRTWDRWRMALIQRNLHDHIVVAGFGTSGSQAVMELIERGTEPGSIVVIDPDSRAIARAEACGCSVYEGDATRDQVLEAVKVARARTVLVSAGRDDTSILITLTARHLAPDAQIAVAVRAEDNELPARQAGANTVINPASFAGLLLASSRHGEHLADYIADLASTTGRVKLAERCVRDDECGKALSEVTTGLGVRIYRDERPIGFWEEEAKSLRPGDVIIEIVEGSGAKERVDPRRV